MSFTSKNPEENKTPPFGIRTMAKASIFIGLFLYATWIRSYFHDFNGLFTKTGNILVGNDFANYWSAARLTLDHHILALFDFHNYHQSQEALFGHVLGLSYYWIYPITFIPLIVWVGFLPYPVALILWLILTFALYVFAVSYKRPKIGELILLLAFAPSTCTNFDSGQNGFLLATLLVGGLRLIDVRPTLAGILFGLLSVKPQLGLLVPVALLVMRKWRVITVAVLTILVMIGISILLFGVEPWRAYLAVVPHLQRTFLEISPSEPFPKMMPTPFMSMRILGASLPVAYGIAAVTALGSVTAVIYAFTRCQSPELRNAVLLTATFLASPYLFRYDMTILSAGIIGTVLVAGSQISPYSLIALSAAWILPVLVFPLGKAGLPIAPIITAALLLAQLQMIGLQRRDGSLPPAEHSLPANS